ncbi:hypothetical protein QWI17_18420 [Gilvimarinus sp. SDUM040013]|uniref:Uncharacterized protein n=1 Tax=Gilvimarinus gilvus TaxID=3058038 RepID=A0ABU4RVA4_9GAMM|nr:hypothetical protein [Gilvimarinus sp. SDUM040013]MDO3387825.1 hypothetical protein [Gilvimarinus sp. SDUM040013]MDX6848804.1 hypothetical protein [Gilvimarinus sp. SDUM040013]
MKSFIFALILTIPSICLATNDTAYLKSLESQASDYRILAIACVIDVKLESKPLAEVDSCGTLYEFTRDEYPALKQSLMDAEKSAQEQGEEKGLQKPILREKLALIMSAKSHMSIAGSILSKVY